MHITSLGTFETVGDLCEMLSTLNPEAKLHFQNEGSAGVAATTHDDGTSITLSMPGSRMPGAIEEG